MTHSPFHSLVEAEHLIVGAGLDLLNERDEFVEDISDWLDPDGSVVEFDADRQIRVTARLKISRELNWACNRVRPWITLTADEATGEYVTGRVLTDDYGRVLTDDDGAWLTDDDPNVSSPVIEPNTVRWDLGVLLMETPTRELEAFPITYEVDCYDKLALLATPHGSTVVVPKGALLLSAAADLIRWNPLSYDGDFVSDTNLDGIADNWAVGTFGTPTSTDRDVITEDGVNFQRLTATLDAGDFQYLYPHDGTAQIRWPVEEGKKYYFTTQLRGTNATGNGARVLIFAYDAAGAQLSFSWKDISPTEEWEVVTVEWVMPAGAVTASVDVRNNMSATVSAVQLDVRQARFTAEGAERVEMDAVAATRTAVEDMIWPADTSTETYDIVADIIAAAGCDPPWVSRAGIFRFTRIVDRERAGTMWHYDADSPTTSVAPARSETIDLWDTPNTWVFLRSGLSQEALSEDGSTLYINENDGPASIAARAGRIVRSVHSLDAADAVAFEDQSLAIVADEMQTGRVIEMATSPNPTHWDHDLVEYSDAAIPGDIDLVTPIKYHVKSWRLPLDGKDMDLRLEEIAHLPEDWPRLSGGYFTGGTVTEQNGMRFHAFTSSGTLTVDTPGWVQVLVVAGGGAGGGRSSGSYAGGGGGGGAIVYGYVYVDANVSITVGAGGTGVTGAQGNDGGTSSFGSHLSAPGGGGGGAGAITGTAGREGGCGGGGGSYASTGGTGGDGTVGYFGGNAIADSGAGGGGGMGSAGFDGADSIDGPGGNGGDGMTIAFVPGTEVAYSAGGGGAAQATTTAGGEGGSDGAGGRGTGDQGGTPTAGSTPGSGGGGRGATNAAGANGAAGIVLVRYGLVE